MKFRDGDRRSSSSVVKKEPKLEPKSEPKAPAPPKSKEVITEELKNKEILYQAKMQIQERMQQLKAQATQPQSMKNTMILKPEEASAFVDYQMEKVCFFTITYFLLVTLQIFSLSHRIKTYFLGKSIK